MKHTPTVARIVLLIVALTAPVLSTACGVAAKSPVYASAHAATQKREVVVYVTRTGEKYHRSSCQYLRKSKIPMALSDAKRSYSPCSVCRPPR